MKKVGLTVLAAAILPAPALAENFATVWTFKPVTATPPTTVELGVPFFEQRPVHYRLVRLSEDLTLGKGKQLAKGTLLYLIMDKTNRIAFCTFKDTSSGNVSKSFFIPALDKRPCLLDDDRDGKFEKTFSVFELWGTVVPTPRGDMKKPKPIAPVAYVEADQNETPPDYSLNFLLHVKGKEVLTPEVQFNFRVKNNNMMQTYPSVKEGETFVSNPFNYKVNMKMVGEKKAEISMTPTGEDIMFVKFDRYVMIKPTDFAKLMAMKP